MANLNIENAKKMADLTALQAVSDSDMLFIHDPDIIQAFCIDRFHKQSNVYQTLIHHIIYRICRCCM